LGGRVRDIGRKEKLMGDMIKKCNIRVYTRNSSRAIKVRGEKSNDVNNSGEIVISSKTFGYAVLTEIFWCRIICWWYIRWAVRGENVRREGEVDR
jgi:adenosine deaminase